MTIKALDRFAKDLEEMWKEKYGRDWMLHYSIQSQAVPIPQIIRSTNRSMTAFTGQEEMAL